MNEVAFVERREPDFLRYYFYERHLLGFTTDTQRHGDAPWWLYIPALLGGGLPWIGYLPVTIKELFATNAPVPCPRWSWACSVGSCLHAHDQRGHGTRVQSYRPAVCFAVSTR